jgi:2-polyprenyl-6-methoxyphenol hydroxylase-like FAD-dependent oxidoreductase
LFHTIVDATTNPADVFCFPARDKKPFYHSADAGPIIFIGDSNHAVSPFAGFGANLALKDGWDLAQKLVAATSLKNAVQGFDALSVPRASKVLETSRWRIKYAHSTGLRFFFFRFLLVVLGFALWLTGRS